MGLLHGLGISAIHVLRRCLPSVRAIPNWLSLLLTFHFVTFAWVFFRAPSYAKATEMLEAVGHGIARGEIGFPSVANVFPLLQIVLFCLAHRFDDHRRIKLAVRKLRRELVWPVIAIGWLLAITVSQGNSAKFIYFNF